MVELAALVIVVVLGPLAVVAAIGAALKMAPYILWLCGAAMVACSGGMSNPGIFLSGVVVAGVSTFWIATRW